MLTDRRQFLKHLGCLTATTTGVASASASVVDSPTSGHSVIPTNPLAVLVDLTNCVGCRLCEHACKKAHDIDAGPVESYDDPSFSAAQRRPSPDAFPVVTAWPASAASTEPSKPVYAKVNCLHCNHPSCVSACIVGALHKDPHTGAVLYDAWK